jgi:flagellar protein FlbD
MGTGAFREASVIRLTRLNGKCLAVNSDLIKFVENAPDTVITLVSGEKVVVRETIDDVISRMTEFRRCVLAGLSLVAGVGFNAVLSCNTADKNAGEELREDQSRG